MQYISLPGAFSVTCGISFEYRASSDMASNHHFGNEIDGRDHPASNGDDGIADASSLPQSSAHENGGGTPGLADELIGEYN